MGIKIMGNASKIFWVYIAYMVITVVLIGLFGDLFSQLVNVEGKLALGGSEVLEVLAYSESGPVTGTNPTVIE